MTILLVNEGWRGPIVFADTGCEWPDTYDYMERFEREWLAPRGMGIERLGEAYRALVPGRDRRSLIAFCEDYAATPFPATRWCTQGWKTDPINHWAKAQGITVQHVGIAADESHRQPTKSRPLCERGITRQGCVEIIQAEGLDVPQKSGCWICPFQRHEQWRELWRRYPDLYERAARLEELSTARRGGVVTMLDPSQRYTLRQRLTIIEQQTTMFDDSELDDLLIYKPCLCGV
jgi:hypothetical protein